LPECHQLDAMSDYLAVKAVPTFIQENAYAPTLSSGWSWTDLRNLNYFIVNCTDAKVALADRKNYLGIANSSGRFSILKK